MPHDKVYQVKENRILFKCRECKSKRSMTVLPGSRMKNVKCHRCGTTSKCRLNRRLKHRQLQSGKATMILPGGKKLTIDLYDISTDGIGCNIEASVVPMLSVKDEVYFSCSWNPELFHQNIYIIRNIRGTRVSVQGETRITQDILL